MNAQTVITHALNPVAVEALVCGQCADYGVTRPATHTARYLSSAQDGRAGRVEHALCASCASERWIYTDVQPLPVASPAPVTPSQGVSLGKATDYAGPGGSVCVVAEWELDRVRSVRNPHMGRIPSWVEESLDLNNLGALRRAFGYLAGGVR